MTSASGRNNPRPAPAPPVRNGNGNNPPPKEPSKWAALAQLITVRSVVMTLVLLMSFAILRPTFQVYLEQQSELNALKAQLVTSQRNLDELQNELLRWEDPNFVRAQARDRLAFVMPGEKAYRVVDPHTITGEPDPNETPEETAANTVPWPVAIWEAAKAIANEDESSDTEN